MRYLILLFIILILTACSSQAPLPTDHYYRLPELTGISLDKERADSISVLMFQADGLFKERAIVHTADEIELEQYHYHHWADSPARLLQERLAELLRMSAFSETVLTTFEGNSDLIIKGQLKSFERIKNADTDKVHISLQLRADKNDGGLPLLYKEYNETTVVKGHSMVFVINAFNSAINSIFNEFYTDLRQALPQ